jgi:tight adherence protein B
VQIVRYTIVGTLAGAALLYAVSGSPVVILIAIVVGPLVTRGLVTRRLAQQRLLFHEQLPSHLQEVASALRGGHSIVGGLTTVSESAVEPTRTEFQRVLADEHLGMPLEHALEGLRNRMASDDIEQLILVAMLARQTGGSMAEVVDRIADAVRERGELRRELHALTAQGRLSRTIVTALPPIVLFFITIINHQYLAPLFNTTTGQILLAVTAGLVFAGWMVMGRIVKIEV